MKERKISKKLTLQGLILIWPKTVNKKKKFVCFLPNQLGLSHVSSLYTLHYSGSLAELDIISLMTAN